MSQVKTREQYRKWIRTSRDPLYKTIDNSKHKDKRWRINQTHIRETFMEEYNNSGTYPCYMLTRTYYEEEDDRDTVVTHNGRMNDVLDDFFNPRGMNEYYLTKDHFIERHKSKLVRKVESKKVFLNTITDEYELDWGNVEVKKGGFHVHTLIGGISDDVVLRPNSRIRKAIPYIYGMEQYPISLMQDEEGIEQIKLDLIEYAIRGRCDFIGNSRSSVNIQPVNEYREYDDYKGWKGMIAYVTKTMYNVDMILEVYDEENSDIL